MKKRKIAVVLSGCGNKDGTEITEAIALITGLSQAGAEMTFFAPNRDFQAKNFLTDQTLKETRNMMVEAARITRSQMNDLAALVAKDFDGLAFPGGFGAALHLSNWAQLGSRCEVLPEVRKAIEDFHRQEKAIAAICIAPVLLAKVLGSQNVTITIGNDKETIQEILKTGAQHEVCPVEDYMTDRHCKVITTPAYMYGSAQPHQVFNGIQSLVKEFVEMA